MLLLGLKVLTWVFPPLLGIFLLGVLTRRGSDRGNLVALATGVSVAMFLGLWKNLFDSVPPLAWTWTAVVGCLLTFGIAALFQGQGRTATNP